MDFGEGDQNKTMLDEY